MYRIIYISIILVLFLASVAGSQTVPDGQGTQTLSTSDLESIKPQYVKKKIVTASMTPKEIRREAKAKRVVRKATDDAMQEFDDLVTLQGKVFFNYSTTAIYEMFCKEGHITDIQLQPGEDLLFVGGGDTLRWVIDKAQSGAGEAKQWHVLVKPLKDKITTNFVIMTDKHSYQIQAKASNFYNPFIGWLYSHEEKMTYLRRQAKEKKHNISGNISPDKLCFAYSIESQHAWFDQPYSWLPKMVFDDGLKTYIQMSDGMKAGEAPALFIKDDGQVNLVNYRVKDNYYVVDRIFNQAELRNGMKETVVITRNGKASK